MTSPLHDSAFNLTNTYKRDSDVTRYFGTIEGLITEARFNANSGVLLVDDKTYFQNLISEKFEPSSQHGTVNTAWYVSNCNHTLGAKLRLDYGQSLIDAGLKLYTEGECFGHVTEKNFNSKNRADAQTEFPTRKLKFYLAFENAYHCTDYVSEKFWRNAFGDLQVPIVFGPHVKDVEAVAPPNSYIHAEDFNSPEELVGYIDYLDRNNTAYLEYHQWRTLYPDGKHRAVDSITGMKKDWQSLCELCRVIRDKRANNEHQYYKSVSAFRI